MAQRITFWRMNGKCDEEIQTVRIKSKKDIPYVMAQLPLGTDVVTLDRTDRQSKICHEIWHSEQYVDLNKR